MNENFGIKNEKEIIKTINGKFLDELPEHFRTPIYAMYRYHHPGKKVEAKKVSSWFGCKSDIEIWLYGHYMNISIKCGFSPAIHQERIDWFLEFLHDLGISNETLDVIRFYHYYDGTLDGSGVKTMRLDDFKIKHKEILAKANEELNQEHIIKAVIYRCVIKGRKSTLQEINYLYYGTAEKGIFINKNDLMKYCPTINMREETAIHIGPLVYVAKYHRQVTCDEKVVQYAQLCWPHIEEDVYKIHNMIRNAKPKN